MKNKKIWFLTLSIVIFKSAVWQSSDGHNPSIRYWAKHKLQQRITKINRTDMTNDKNSNELKWAELKFIDEIYSIRESWFSIVQRNLTLITICRKAHLTAKNSFRSKQIYNFSFIKDCNQQKGQLCWSCMVSVLLWTWHFSRAASASSCVWHVGYWNFV